MSAAQKIRCAIYTRKSSEEGLEQNFNSLDAQAEACAAYIASQKHEGWVLLPTRCDDGGISGGTLERPGLQSLLADSRGRIYHLLSNPVYIGRIRHGEEDYPGQHDPIIDRDNWDWAQAMLAGNTGRAKRCKTTATPSPLAGRFTDETGDVLTPSHANKKGRRYRYYVSRRLIIRSGEEPLDGWRRPAAVLERAVADLIKGWLADPSTPSRLIHRIEAAEIGVLKSKLDGLAHELDGNNMGDLLRDVIGKGEIAPNALTIILDASSLAYRLGVAQGRIAQDALTLTTGFTLRRRGVETRLILDAPPPRVDRTLLRNVAQGHAWFHEIQRGMSIKEIAVRENTTRQRLTAVVELAFLAPDLVRQIVEGRQPVSLTSDRLIKAGIPTLWTDQRAILADI